MPKKSPAKKGPAKKTAAKKSTTRKSTARKTATTHIKNNVKGKKEKFTFNKFLVAFGFIILPFVVGIVSTLLTGNAMIDFGILNQPLLTPPVWVFPIVWTVLYILMGIASYLVYKLKPTTPVEKNLKKTELTIYYIQLVFNLCWAIFFFRFKLRYFAFGWLIAMWLIIFALIHMTFKNRKSAAYCLIPYALWCTFSIYLNIMIAILN